MENCTKPGLEDELSDPSASLTLFAPTDEAFDALPAGVLADLGTTEHRISFVNLPVEATIRVYTLTGILVDVIDHVDASGGGRAEWDLRNRNNNFIASGVYFFHVVTPAGDEHVGKFTVVNFGAQN